LIKQNLSTPAPVLQFMKTANMYSNLKHSSENHSRSCSNQKYPLLVLLRILLKNANSCRSRFQRRQLPPTSRAYGFMEVTRDMEVTGNRINTDTVIKSLIK